MSIISAFFKKCKAKDKCEKPAIRGGTAVCAVDDRVYIFGGATRSDMVGDAFRWDGNRWFKLELADMTRDRNHLGLSGMSATPVTFKREGEDTDSTSIVLFGGQDCETSRQSDNMWELTELHIDQVQAKQLHAIDGPKPRNSHDRASVSYVYVPVFQGLGSENKKLMIWGGADDTGHRDDGFLYDFSQKKWEPLKKSKPKPCAREMFSLTCFGDNAVLIGGKTEQGVPTDLWSYNLETGWKKSSQEVPFMRMSHTTTAITPAGENEKPMLVVFGGVEFSEDGNMGFPQGIYIGTVENEKDLSIGWTAVEGESSGKNVWASARFGHSSCSYKNDTTMIIFGGSTPETELNDLWEVDLQQAKVGQEISFAAGNNQIAAGN